MAGSSKKRSAAKAPLVVPEGARPEEFMTDDALAAYYAAEHDAAPDPQSKRRMHRAAVAAALTNAAANETLAEDVEPGIDHKHAVRGFIGTVPQE